MSSTQQVDVISNSPREKRRRRIKADLTSSDNRIARLLAALEHEQRKRKRIESDSDEVNELSDERIDALARKAEVRAFLAAVRLTFTGNPRKKGTMPGAVRVCEMIFKRWRDAGWPNDGVALHQAEIAKKTRITERQVQRITNGRLRKFIYVTLRISAPSLYRPRLEDYDEQQEET